MESAKHKRHAVLLLIVILGYLETLRRGTFYAFGWAGHGQAFTIVSVVVLNYLLVDYLYPSRFRKIVSALSGLLYIGMVWFFNSKSGAASQSYFSGFIFGLPDFRLGEMSPDQYGVFCFFAVFFYALTVFLVAGFILEKKSITEIFLAGTLLMSVEIISSDRGLLVYVVLNVLFLMVLHSQVFFLELESDFRIRSVRGTGLRNSTWAGISLAIAVCIISVSITLPSGKTRIDLTSSGGNFIQQAALTVSETGSDDFELYWEKMQGFEMKGEVLLEDKLAMYVKSPVPSYWRGESLDYYTGRGWKSSLSPVNIDGESIKNPYSRNVPVKKVEQAFILSSEMSSQVIFSSGSPASIQLPDDISTDEGDNFYTTKIKPGITYKVTSYVPERNPSRLKLSPQEFPIEIRRLYLQLPEELPERVRKLAEKLTGSADNQYDKVKLIESYLSLNYPYSLTVSKIPHSRDAADCFIFDIRKGYCTYHSTAMAIMLRSIGIPARWVKGFTTGVYDPDTGVYQVNMNNAHAWVEVYFADYGWVPFEPTPSFVLPEAGSDDNLKPLKKADITESNSLVRVSPDEILTRPEKSFPWWALAAAGMLVFGLAAYYFWKKKNIFKLGTGNKMRDTYLEFLNVLAQLGYPKTASQTPIEYAESLSEKFHNDYADIFGITNAYIRDRYGSEKLSKEELEHIRGTWKKLAAKWLSKSRD